MLKEDFFENEEFSDEEKANAAFQIVTGMRDVLNVALKSNYVPTYQKAIAYIKDISPAIYDTIIDYLPEKVESDLVKRFKESADAEIEFKESENYDSILSSTAISMIQQEIDKCDATIQKNSKSSKDVKANRGYKKQLLSALKSFDVRKMNEHELLSHDFYIANRKEFKLIDEEVDRKDYRLPDGKILRLYLAHPNKIEQVLGVDVIYECYDLRLNMVRFAHLQYKTWKTLSLSFDEREKRQLERMYTNTCACNHCEVPSAFASASPYRFPYCAAFLRPTNKIMPKGSKMMTMGDHIPLCKINELRASTEQILKHSIQEISLTQQGFEEAFNKFHVGSRWMPIGDLEEYYRKRNLTDLSGNVRIIAQEIAFNEVEF
ncbi:hypothetical protein EZ428_15520 [Pedobacter frigiditerrae]|uniref:Uncharacterized protein n=1 Tax=Pedobacter frigiditerrae TaxID=2530452 RepID=A0A4R0MQE3_9SPHI|nr:hypothetical protein [Pedobacter frigiditerrae]TCC89109.1 hypothetical protein EZ428_15520 [Pedobacter frigiditerrae]